MAMNWKEPETKNKFLLSVLSTQDDNVLSSTKAVKIAEYMGCTPKAVTHQLAALRKELTAFKSADGQAAVSPTKKRKAKGSDGEDSGSPTKKTKATPKKRTPKAKKAQEMKEDSEDDVDVEVAARKDRAEGKEVEVNGGDGDVNDESN